jgi:hypothetical protein
VYLEKGKLINSSSTYNKDESTHVTLYTYSFYIDEIKFYGSTKHIFHRNYIYKWSMKYSKLSDQSIFDNNQKRVKVIK